MESFMIRSSHCRSSNNYNFHKANKQEEEENGILPSLSQLPNFRRKMGGSTTTAAIMRSSESDDATMKMKMKKNVVAAEKSEPPPLEDINQSAEAFIKKFRQQLVIQRLESIENYEKMLARGT